MFNLGGSEILVLAFLALILFGNKSLPSNMKKMVKGLNEAKKFANDAQRSWTEIRDDVTRQIMADDALEQAKKDLRELKKTLEQPLEKPALPSPEHHEDLQHAQAGHESHDGLLPLDDPDSLAPPHTIDRHMSLEPASLDSSPQSVNPDLKDSTTRDNDTRVGADPAPHRDELLQPENPRAPIDRDV